MFLLAFNEQIGMRVMYPMRMVMIKLLLVLVRKRATHANNDKVTKSPKAAAIGVATLSGLTLYLLDTAITANITRPKMKEAADAVTTLLDVRIRALPISTLSMYPNHAIIMAIIDANPPTTMP